MMTAPVRNLPATLMAAAAFGLGLAPVDSRADCSAKNQDPRKAHVELRLTSLPRLQFYRAADLAGPPVMRLDERGLHVGTELACAWPGGSFRATAEPNRVLGFDGSTIAYPCAGDLPVKSGFGDGGIGTAVLCVEVRRVTRGLAKVPYRGADLYLDLRSLPKGSWSYEPRREKRAPRGPRER
jgi:hypothetical protein